MSKPDLTILIYANQQLSVRQALRRLRSQAPRLDLEVIVIGNQPKVGDFSWLRYQFPEVRYLPVNVINQGQGLSQAIQGAQGKYLLLHSENSVWLPGALDKVLAYMERHPEVGVLGPKVILSNGEVQATVGQFNVTNQLTQTDVTQEVDWLADLGLCLQTKAVHQLGGLEDVSQNWCWQMWEQGYKVVYLAEAAVIHYASKVPAGEVFFQQLNNTYKFFRPHSGQANPRDVPRLSPTAPPNLRLD